MYTRTNMAGKLYWRIKKNGKWTWTPARTGVTVHDYNTNVHYVRVYKEEEE